MRTILILLALMVAGQSALAAETVPRSWWSKWEFSLGCWSNPGYDLNVPLSVRAVPRHPDDTWLADYSEANSPLPDSKYDFNQGSTIELTATKVLNKFCSVGVLCRSLGGSGSQRYTQNQYGTPERGYGMSLRYYELASDCKDQFGLIGFLDTPWAKYRLIRARIRVGGFYALTDQDIVYRNGYDRNDSDQRYGTQTVARLHQDDVFVRGEIGGLVCNSKYPHGFGVAAAYIQFDHRTDRWTLADSAPDFTSHQHPRSGPSISGGLTISLF